MGVWQNDANISNLNKTEYDCQKMLFMHMLEFQAGGI